MQFTVKQMRQPDAQQIAAWHHPPPYDFYDWDQDPHDLAELLDPRSWRESYNAVFDEQNTLAGSFVFKPDGAPTRSACAQI